MRQTKLQHLQEWRWPWAVLVCLLAWRFAIALWLCGQGCTTGSNRADTSVGYSTSNHVAGVSHRAVAWKRRTRREPQGSVLGARYQDGFAKKLWATPEHGSIWLMLWECPSSW